MQKYLSVYRESIENKEQFWSKAAEAIDWSKPWNKVLNQSNSPFNLWFEGGRLNTCYNALDRHVKNGLGETTALIYDSPVTNTKKSYTYSKLTNKVSVLAGTLKDLGIEKGDRVIIYMPMIPEAIMSMLACARIGAIHSVVFGGFAAKELATRIDDAQPKLIISASCGIEISKVIEYKPLLDKAIEIAEHKPQKLSDFATATSQSGNDE